MNYFFFISSSERVEIDLPSVASHLMELRSLRSEKCPNVVSFEEDLCVDSNLTGGKASSLAVLMRLSKESGEVRNNHECTSSIKRVRKIE